MYLVEETEAPRGYEKPTTYFVFKIDAEGVHDETGILTGGKLDEDSLTKVVDPSDPSKSDTYKIP